MGVNQALVRIRHSGRAGDSGRDIFEKEHLITRKIKINKSSIPRFQFGLAHRVGLGLGVTTEDVSLYTAWERFRRLLKRCPMHSIGLTTQMDIFYHSMNYTSKGIIDARKSAEKAKQLVEDFSKCNYRAPSETSGSNNRLKEGVIELNRMTDIEAKLYALMSKMGNQERRMHSAHEV